MNYSDLLITSSLIVMIFALVSYWYMLKLEIKYINIIRQIPKTRKKEDFSIVNQSKESFDKK